LLAHLPFSRFESGSKSLVVTDCGTTTTFFSLLGYAHDPVPSSVLLRYGEHQLTVPKMLLAINNSLISLEFATGYVTNTWDQRMHILITITSCGTLVNQSLSKTAFAVTLLKLTKTWAHQGYQWILWFCIVSMNLFMIVKVIFQWGKVCGKKSYDVDWRLDFCLESKFRDDFKEGGNGELRHMGLTSTSR
jgi:hypothetical protein